MYIIYTHRYTTPTVAKSPQTTHPWDHLSFLQYNDSCDIIAFLLPNFVLYNKNIERTSWTEGCSKVHSRVNYFANLKQKNSRKNHPLNAATPRQCPKDRGNFNGLSKAKPLQQSSRGASFAFEATLPDCLLSRRLSFHIFH